MLHFTWTIKTTIFQSQFEKHQIRRKELAVLHVRKTLKKTLEKLQEQVFRKTKVALCTNQLGVTQLWGYMSEKDP